MAVERVYVAELIYEPFVAQAAAAAAALRQGHSPALDAPFQVGPVTYAQQLAVVERHMADALAKGARVLIGGRGHGLYYEPTVLVEVTHDMLIMREETFGPIMPIMRVADEAEAIRLANDSVFGLSASVWSRDHAHAEAVARQLNTGSVIINDTIAHFGVPQMPFGGLKDSGFGRTHGRDGLRQFTQPFALAVGAPPQPLDVATMLRRPGHYGLASALLHLVFGVTPEQRLRPVVAAARRATRQDPGRIVLSAAAAGLFGALAFAFSARRAKRRSPRQHGG